MCRYVVLNSVCSSREITVYMCRERFPEKQCATYTFLLPMGMAKTYITSMPAHHVQTAYAHETIPQCRSRG